jgi:hypothetical protein
MSAPEITRESGVGLPTDQRLALSMASVRIAEVYAGGPKALVDTLSGDVWSALDGAAENLMVGGPEAVTDAELDAIAAELAALLEPKGGKPAAPTIDLSAMQPAVPAAEELLPIAAA